MNITIHGTKGGYRVLYSTSNSLLTASDSHSAVSCERAVGQSAYSIAFAANGCVFTKYVIARDNVMRSIATGNIAFSVHLPSNQRLSGVEVKSLLDKLSIHYCMQYAPENNLENIHEDWAFVENIARNFTAKNVPCIENIQQGMADAAYVYYSSDIELQKHFDIPYQDEYRNYRQVFFVEKRLEGMPENPLNALRHNPAENLTGGIDSENTNYEPLFEKQKAESLNTVVPIQLQPETVTIPVIVIDGFSKKGIPNYQIICKGSYNQIQKEVNNNQVVFEGDEIKTSWNIEVTADEYKKEENKFIPKETSSITFELERLKVFSIEVIDKEKNETLSPDDYELNIFDDIRQTPQYCVKNDENKFAFVGNEIRKEWHIEVERRDHDGFCERLTICPKDEEANYPIKVYIEKKRQTNIYESYIDSRKGNLFFSFIAGENGKIISGSTEYGPYPNYEDYRKAIAYVKVKPDFGYKIKRLKEKYSYQNRYTFEIQFKRIISLKLLMILGIIAVLGSLFFVLFKPSKDVFRGKEAQIAQYVEGDTLFLNVLNNYKTELEKQKPEIKKGSGWLSVIGIGSQEEKPDSSNYKNWHNALQNIDKAIIKRKLITDSNFAELKNQSYSPKQERFKIAVENIDSAEYESIGEQLGDISSLTLNQIADSIMTILILKESSIEQQKSGSKKNKQKAGQNTSLPKTVTSSLIQHASKDITTEIIHYLKGSELKKATLESYKSKTTNNDLKRSIDLALKFWRLDGRRNNSYFSYQSELENDNNLNNSDLSAFIDFMCTKERPRYLTELSGADQNKNLAQLKNRLR